LSIKLRSVIHSDKGSRDHMSRLFSIVFPDGEVVLGDRLDDLRLFGGPDVLFIDMRSIPGGSSVGRARSFLEVFDGLSPVPNAIIFAACVKDKLDEEDGEIDDEFRSLINDHFARASARPLVVQFWEYVVVPEISPEIFLWTLYRRDTER
jgi:hypothetical protein